ncbi:hypothetical protein H6P81_018080 [Aristolochia fimbriata]|uniref:Reverse transcriptase domain-containing protein n=1 Tax=Aristolochia fimbriata TaxID=158543 RepID=A0AAV7E2X4_ARIFI|nr:hypothetical protein H6P81_018080 [Aristolochia fimbriata]
MVFADECLFTEAEASFADAKFHSEEKSTSSSKINLSKAAKDERANPKGQMEEPVLRLVSIKSQPKERLPPQKEPEHQPLIGSVSQSHESRHSFDWGKKKKTEVQTFPRGQVTSINSKLQKFGRKRGKKKTLNQTPPLHRRQKKSVYYRGWVTKQPKRTIFQRLGAPTRVPVSQRLGKIGENSSKIIKAESSEVTPVVIYMSSKKRDPEEEEAVAVHHITAGEGDDPTPEDDLGEAPAIFEEGGQATIDQLKKVNLGTEDDPRPTFLSTSLSVTEEKDYMSLLNEYKDVFAWSYTEMPGLDPTIAIHKLAIKSGVKPVKQTQRQFRPVLVLEIEKEVDKLLKADFIREVKYPSWIANIVPVKKKNEQIRICVDFRDLNKTCPKDDFPLPITELMEDATTGHEALSLMDGSSGYNQIRMDPKDEEKTAFRTPKGIFCYKVMSFGLKNARATYQRDMQRIFDDILHKFMECYVDDLVVKTKSRDDHLKDLRATFERLRWYQLKMNPLKCVFGVSSGKFLGFVVRHRGIEIDQTKIDVIQRMPEPKTLSELKSLQGHLAYIRRFISNLAERCQLFSRLMKKDTPFEWDESCPRAFENIKDYLMKPPVFMAPVLGKPLLLYIAAQKKSLGALLAQTDDQGKERPLYYLIRTMVGAELNYSPIKKTCLALIFAIQKLRHYLLAHSTNLISPADSLKYIMSRPILSGRLAKWALLLSEFEINFIP